MESKKIVLSETADWDTWISIIRQRAESFRIWDLINPDTTQRPFKLPYPIAPIFLFPENDEDIDSKAYNKHKIQLSNYKTLLSEWERQDRAFSDILTLIQTTISSDNIIFIEKVESHPYEILKRLKQKLAPSNQARMQKVEEEYRRLCKGPKNQDVNKWLDQWTRTYSIAKELNIGEISGTRPARDFVLATKKIDPHFSAVQMMNIVDLNPDDDSIDVCKLIEKFRHFVKLEGNVKESKTHSAFSAEETSKNPSKEKSSEPSYKGKTLGPSPCVCGSTHWWADCYYLNMRKRPSNWKPNTQTQQKVDEALKDKDLKNKIEVSIRKRKDIEDKASKNSSSEGPKDASSSSRDSSPTSSNVMSLFPIATNTSFSSSSDYILKASWILDHGSNTHLCNKTMKHRFIKEREGSGETIIAGTQILPIEAYGSVIITCEGNKGKIRKIQLSNVSYVSNFMVNIVSGIILHRKGVDFDTQHARLHQDGSTFGYAKLLHGHFVMEYNLFSSSQTSTSTIIMVDKGKQDVDGAMPPQKSPRSKDKIVVYSDDKDVNGVIYPKDANTPTGRVEEEKSLASRKHPAEGLFMRTPDAVFPTIKTASTKDWHDILAHANNDVIRNLEKSVEGVKVSDGIDAPKTNECETCALSKSHRLISRSNAKSEESDKPFYRVTYDLMQLNPGMNKDQWISHLACSTTNFNLVFTHPRKSDATDIVRKGLEIIKTRFDAKIVFFRTDGERSLGKEFDEMISALGITYEPSAPDTPQQNGHSERQGGLLAMKARSLRIEANLPIYLWPWIVKAAGFIMNRTPMMKHNWKTPFELAIHTKPNLSHMHKFGCKAYSLDKSIPGKEKLRERAHIGHLLGYDGTNIYFIWIPSQRKVIRTRDVIFDETSFYDPSKPDLSQSTKEPIESIYDIPPLNTTRITEIESDSDEEEPISEEVDNMDKGTRGEGKAKEVDTEILQLPTPTPEPESYMPSSRDDTPSNEDHQEQSSNQKRRGFVPTPPAPRDIVGKVDDSNIIPEGVSRKRIKKQLHSIALKNAESGGFKAYHEAFVCFLSSRNYYLSSFSMTSTTVVEAFSDRASSTIHPHRDTLPPEPQNYRQMIKHPHAPGFKQAVQVELGQLTSKGVWKEVPHHEAIQTGKTPIPTTWVFKYKFDEQGFLVKYKARLCARGDLQQTQQNTFAATLAIRIFRALMAIVAVFDLETRQYDALNAFINSKIDEPTFCYPPEGWKKETTANRILLLLLKALYGLKQSPALWYKHLSKTLSDLGLKQVPGIECLFVNAFMILFFFVDDIAILYHRQYEPQIDEFQARFFQAYEMRYLGEVQWFLGIRIERNRLHRHLSLHQDSYIDKLIAKFNVDANISSKISKTPLSFYEKLKKNPHKATSEQIFEYQQKIGSINFASVTTRPDTSFAASKLSEFLINPSPQHMDAANNLLRYLANTKDYAIGYYPPMDDLQTIFMGSSDASYADDKETRHSSQGYCFQLFNGMVDWKASKQKTVTTSSTEAELLALSSAAKELIWWNRFFESIDFDLNLTTHIECDNIQTIRTFSTETSQFTTKLRHVDVHRHWLRQEVQNGTITIKYTPSSIIIAEGLTKALPPQKHKEFIKHLGLEASRKGLCGYAS